MLTVYTAVCYLQLQFRKCARITDRFTFELEEFLRRAFVDPYHCGLLVQAEYLFRNSELYAIRLKELGYAHATDSFNGGVAAYFFAQAQKEHWHIRLRIWRDAMLGREAKPYTCRKTREGE